MNSRKELLYLVAIDVIREKRNIIREKRRKELAQQEVDYQCGEKYLQECKYKGIRKLTPQEVECYIEAKNKDTYLKSIGKFECEVI